MRAAAGGGGAGAGAGGDGQGLEVGAREAVALAGLAARWGDAGLQEAWARRMAESFGELRGESLAALPAAVVARVLGDEGLAAASEDEVYEAAEAYVRERGPAGLTAGEAVEVWRSVRFLQVNYYYFNLILISI